MKRLLLAAFFVSAAACGDDYGNACTMDSDCRTGVGCWCASMDEAGECPGNTGTCLSPTDFQARSAGN